jgi:hypothetical protein
MSFPQVFAYVFDSGLRRVVPEDCGTASRSGPKFAVVKIDERQPSEVT